MKKFIIYFAGFIFLVVSSLAIDHLFLYGGTMEGLAGYALLGLMLGYTSICLIRFSNIQWLGWFLAAVLPMAAVGEFMNERVTVSNMLNIVSFGVGGIFAQIIHTLKMKLRSNSSTDTD